MWNLVLFVNITWGYLSAEHWVLYGLQNKCMIYCQTLVITFKYPQKFIFRCFLSRWLTPCSVTTIFTPREQHSKLATDCKSKWLRYFWSRLDIYNSPAAMHRVLFLLVGSHRPRVKSQSARVKELVKTAHCSTGCA